MIYFLLILMLRTSFAKSEDTFQPDDVVIGTFPSEKRSDEKFFIQDLVNASNVRDADEKLFIQDLVNASNVRESSDSDCLVLTNSTGNITHTFTGLQYTEYTRCWKIMNPNNQLLRLNIINLDFQIWTCDFMYMIVLENNSGGNFKYCKYDDYHKPIVIYSEVIVHFYIGSHVTVDLARIHLLYDIDTSIRGLKGLEVARKNAISWMKHNASSGPWIENISKVVTTLALSSETIFKDSDAQDYLLLKQNNLRIHVLLLRDTVSIEQLSVFINSLVASCHNPKNFYGQDLVKKLKTQIESSENSTHPAAYLALCNANEPWPKKANKDLIDVFESQSKYPFFRDIQSFASLAISCKLKQSKTFNSSSNSKLMSSYELNLQRLKVEQKEDGNFGNAHRTALTTQVLLAAGQENKEDWNSIEAVKYLMQSINSSNASFLTTYLTLPTLNSKTLAHISSINCSGIQRNNDDLVTEIHDYKGPKISIRYSLFLEKDKQNFHTSTLIVPENFTAYDVMQFAEIKDSKYRFLFEMVEGKMDIYDISGTSNDPEESKFWLLYLRRKNEKNLYHLTTSPDKLMLKDGDHLVMWYRTTRI